MSEVIYYYKYGTFFICIQQVEFFNLEKIIFASVRNTGNSVYAVWSVLFIKFSPLRSQNAAHKHNSHKQKGRRKPQIFEIA